MNAASAGVSGSHAAFAFTFFSSTSTMGSIRVAYLCVREMCKRAHMFVCVCVCMWVYVMCVCACVHVRVRARVRV